MEEAMEEAMEEIKVYNWGTIKEEIVTDTIKRRVLTGERSMLAQIYLEKGSIVPAHSHDNEQFTYVLKGSLKFILGKDKLKEVIVNQGDVLRIPSNLLHSVEALEDTLDLDVFTPIRHDWLDGTDSYFKASPSK